MDVEGVVVLVAFIVIIVAVIAYRVGYLWAQVEFLNISQMIEAKRSMLPMEAPIPPWRRVAGWAAYMFSALLLCLFLAVAYWHAYSWGWTYSMAVWILWFAIFLGGIGPAEWCWKPRAAERGTNGARTEESAHDHGHPRPQEHRRGAGGQTPSALSTRMDLPMDERAPVVAELAAEPFRLETRVAIDAVKRALTIARGGLGAEDAREKGGRDLVTVVDIAVEDAVRSVLGAVPVVGEERGGEAPADGAPYWLLDPICGTRNFASGVPLYCVNLALVEGGEVTVAVVGDPSRSEIDVAERGRGAWRLQNGHRHRLTTSDESQTVVIEEGKSKGGRREQAAQVLASAIRADRWDVRSFGTTLASPYLAAGRVAAYVVFWVPAIHTAAGSLLIAEAGGTVSDIDGRPWSIGSDSFVASANRLLHEELLALVRTRPRLGDG